MDIHINCTGINYIFLNCFHRYTSYLSWGGDVNEKDSLAPGCILNDADCLCVPTSRQVEIKNFNAACSVLLHYCIGVLTGRALTLLAACTLFR